MRGEWEMGKWADLASELRSKLWLRTHPIGYKRFENPGDLDKIPDLKRPEHFSVFCQMIAQARKLGLTVGAKDTDPVYSHCARIHGLMAIPPGLDTPVHGLKWCGSWEDERKRFKAFPRIMAGGGVVLAPLSTITFDPDVILIYGDPAQIILIIQSMQKKEFERFQFACMGESSCADSLADCYLSGKPKVGLPGVGERVLGHVREDELVIALPPLYMDRALDGLRELGLTYPIPPNMSIDLDVKSGFARLYPDDPEFK
jgi:uncharacterized protein (DUF169 family)